MVTDGESYGNENMKKISSRRMHDATLGDRPSVSGVSRRRHVLTSVRAAKAVSSSQPFRHV